MSDLAMRFLEVANAEEAMRDYFESFHANLPEVFAEGDVWVRFMERVSYPELLRRQAEVYAANLGEDTLLALIDLFEQPAMREYRLVQSRIQSESLKIGAEYARELMDEVLP